MQRGASYVGSTGWAYGMENVLAYQEVLMTEFTRLLAQGAGSSLGDALVLAKQTYFKTHEMNHFHAKTLAGTVLYGLPMLHVRTRGGGRFSRKTAKIC